MSLPIASNLPTEQIWSGDSFAFVSDYRTNNDDKKCAGDI